MNKLALYDLHLLRSFEAVATCGSFTAAAEQLHLTQSTVSQQVRRLEVRIGKPLFSRSTRTVALTKEGEVLRGYASSLLQLAEEGAARLAAPELQGDLSLGVSDDLAQYLLPDVLRQFKRSHRAVRLDVQVGLTATLCERMMAGGLDLVVGKAVPGSATGEVIGGDRLVWAGDTRLAEDPERPVPLALFPEACVYRRAALEALARAGRCWEVVCTSPSLSGIQAAVKAGLAVSPLAACFTRDLPVLEARTSGLPALPPVDFAVFWSARSKSQPAARQLVAALEHAMRPAPASLPTLTEARGRR
ncbi:LysR family transcriptional regulator [Stappia taiwanensis]|uniref:LysR family transcriptional regulator n=1 Tax=Stappia taiwanensis TaxID=992267 RepID=A0A838XWA2_9HYPH|nr:LysR substrate-binding domain-containing protein [Stappia taiwanensis]MBA4613301.1 LysR family transcriptional regulator [Stappia taiwanensis]GGE81003.1 LysR family transcriptional regulator [Stappia taiwanensis]